jgi:alpha-L-rhamnosidase
VVEPLAFAKASFQSPYGKIVSDWKKADDTLWLNLTVPPNTTATLILPAKSADGVQEDGKDLAAQPGIANAAFSDGALQCEVGAGSYQFSSRLK